MNQWWLGVYYDECHDVVVCPSYMQNVNLRRYCFLKVIVVNRELWWCFDDDNDDDFNGDDLLMVMNYYMQKDDEIDGVLMYEKCWCWRFVEWTYALLSHMFMLS